MAPSYHRPSGPVKEAGRGIAEKLQQAQPCIFPPAQNVLEGSPGYYPYARIYVMKNFDIFQTLLRWKI